MLTSAQNNRVKLVRRLQQQHNARVTERLFVAEGSRLCDDFLSAGLLPMFAFIGPPAPAQRWRDEHPRIECLDLSDAVMRSVSQESTPPGVVVVFQQISHDIAQLAADLPHQILILDAMHDPGNLGACLRVAAGADCSLVLLAPGSVDPYNPKVVRGGMGAHARIRVVTAMWDEIRSLNAGRLIWAADAIGDNTYDGVTWTHPNALMIGSEATGLSVDARALTTGTVTIPLMNNVESLNAAVACGIILFESARQRRTA